MTHSRALCLNQAALVDLELMLRDRDDKVLLTIEKCKRKQGERHACTKELHAGCYFIDIDLTPAVFRGGDYNAI